MGFQQKWEAAKKKFTVASGKSKKPSKKVLGIFSKGTGIEKALKKIDKDLASKKSFDKQWAEISKHKKEYDTVSAKYQGMLNNAIKDDGKDAAYTKAADQLKSDLLAINKLVTQALMDLLDADKKTVAARAKVDNFVGELQKKIASRYQ